MYCFKIDRFIELLLSQAQEGLLPVGKRRGYFVNVYKLMLDPTEHAEPVTGMVLEPFPRHAGPSNRWFVLATTPRRIYQFIGQVNRGDTPLFLELFSFYTDHVKSKLCEVITVAPIPRP